MCVLLIIYGVWPNCDLRLKMWPIWGTMVPKVEPMGAQRHQVVAQWGARCEPKGSQGTKMRAQRGPNGSQWGPHDSPEGPKLEPRGPQERKIEK